MTGPLKQEQAIKLDMLHSLARSQRALARLIECAADITDADDGMKLGLKRNLAALAAYQRALAEGIVGIRIHRVISGKPGAIWLDRRVRPGGR